MSQERPWAHRLTQLNDLHFHTKQLDSEGQTERNQLERKDRDADTLEAIMQQQKELVSAHVRPVIDAQSAQAERDRILAEGMEGQRRLRELGQRVIR